MSDSSHDSAARVDLVGWKREHQRRRYERLKSRLRRAEDELADLRRAMDEAEGRESLLLNELERVTMSDSGAAE